MEEGENKRKNQKRGVLQFMTMTMAIQDTEKSSPPAAPTTRTGKCPFKKLVGDASDKLQTIRTDVGETLLRMIASASETAATKEILQCFERSDPATATTNDSDDLARTISDGSDDEVIVSFCRIDLKTAQREHLILPTDGASTLTLAELWEKVTWEKVKRRRNASSSFVMRNTTKNGTELEFRESTWGTVNLGTLLKKANSKQEVTISVYEWDFRWNGR